MLFRKDRVINLFVLFICYQSILPITKKQETSTKYRALVHQRAVERLCYFEDFHRKCTKQPERTILDTSKGTFINRNAHMVHIVNLIRFKMVYISQ